MKRETEAFRRLARALDQLAVQVFRDPAIGPSESTNYRLGSGYWYGVSPTEECLPGDANEDGVVNVLDLPIEKQIILGQLPPTCGADANQDGEINVLDLVEIKLIIMGQ